MLNRDGFYFQPTLKPPKGNGHLWPPEKVKKAMVSWESPLGRGRQSQQASSTSPPSSLPPCLATRTLYSSHPLRLSTPLLVDRPTHLICISDNYLLSMSTDKYKRHSRAICVNIRARWEFIFCSDDLPYMFFNVKFNSKASLFSSTFWFERSFRSENAILVLGVFTL